MRIGVTMNTNTAKVESGARTYVMIWAYLMVLTIVTVASATIDLGGLAIIVCLAIAALKSTLVFLYFMHLRHEKRMVIKLIIPIAMFTLAIFIGITFTDIIFR
jgi:cytochrome c oxidase subunit 4